MTKKAHAAPVSPAHTHAEPAAASPFAALLAGDVTSAPDTSLLNDLLAMPLASGSTRRLVVCVLCGDPECQYSYYIDDRTGRVEFGTKPAM